MGRRLLGFFFLLAFLSVSVDVLCTLSLSLQVQFLSSSVLDRRNTAHTGLSWVDEIKDRLYSVLKVR